MFKFNPLSGKFEIDSGFEANQIVCAQVSNPNPPGTDGSFSINLYQRNNSLTILEVLFDQDGNVIIWE